MHSRVKMFFVLLKAESRGENPLPLLLIKLTAVDHLDESIIILINLELLSSGAWQLDKLVFGCLCNVGGSNGAQRAGTHTSCSAQGQMVHLLGDRAHHAGRLHGHSVVHGWRDHCTLVERE